MNNHQDYLKSLEEKLEVLLSKQEGFAKELMGLYREIDNLKKGDFSLNTTKQEVIKPAKEKIAPNEPAPQIPSEATNPQPIEIPKPQPAPSVQKIVKPKGKSNLEKFIGENLINKIGILITVIGVVIGAKYSIENNLISPLTRVILGYVFGLTLLGFGIKLKAKYLNYSAVLVSGAIAILYFITFAGYSFYELFPQLMAFGLMLLLTVFTIVAALNYNKQIIAHIGLVGAYAVPFLLSNNSGDVFSLFCYVAIINIGILIVSIKKYWKPLYYVSFTFTWLIYMAWLFMEYIDEQFNIAFGFLTAFFIIFYITFITYKLVKKEQFNAGDVVILFLNSFVYYGLGFYILSDHQTGKELLGVFTLSNAVVHFIMASVIFKQKLADKKLFYLITALVLTFITITIPVQLDGSWVTVLWAAEAAILYWFGVTKNISIYKKLSYILTSLAFISLIEDWNYNYDTYIKDDLETRITPLLNINFLSSLLVIAPFAFMLWLTVSKKYKVDSTTIVSKISAVGLSILLLIVIYFAFLMEISCYWDQLFQDSMISFTNTESYESITSNYNLIDLKDIWIFNYTLLFFTILSFINIKKIQNRVLGISNLAINLLVIFGFLTVGLYTISELRSNYILENLSEYYQIGKFNIGIRYVSLALLGLLLYVSHLYTKQEFMKVNLKVTFELLIHGAIVWILSSELLHWMHLAGISGSYKMNLSILWGAYSLFLISIGIWKQKKYLRIAGISLFGVTLVKLFFYDIADLDTISKIIVLVSLGLLLLVISFLYNKYTKQIENDSKNE